MTKLGKFEIHEQLGRGGMGLVYRAWDPTMQRWVALKTITQDKAARAEFVKRFRREAVAAGGLDHPNIVTIYETGEEGDVCYIAMQFLEGSDMESLIKSPDWDEEFSIFRKLDVLVQVCRGLAYAHSKAVVHRDVKPANVMILPDGTAKVVDFGIARIGETTSTSQVIVGTASYMAPEQLQGNVVDERADVFAVGVLAYRMFTRRLPFEGDNVSGILYKILHGPPPRLSAYAADCPPDLEKIVLTALAKDRDQRYRTMEELGFEFQRLLGSLNATQVSSYIEEARRLLLTGVPLKAKELLRKVLELDPANAAASEMWHQVQKLIQEEHDRRKAQSLQEEGIQAYGRGDWVRALECFNLGLQLDQNNETLLNYRDLTLREQEKIQAIKQKMNAAHAAERRGDQTAARGYLLETLQLSPQNAEAKALLAQVEGELAQIQNRREAQQIVDRAQRALTARSYPEALSLLEKAQALDPENRHVARLRSSVLADQAAAQKQRLRGEKIAAAKAALERGDFSVALEEAQNGLQAFPDDPALQQLLLGAKQGREAAEHRKGEPEPTAPASGAPTRDFTPGPPLKEEPEPTAPASTPLGFVARVRGVLRRFPAQSSTGVHPWLREAVNRLPVRLRPSELQLRVAGGVLLVIATGVLTLALIARVISRPTAIKPPPALLPPGAVSLDVLPWGEVKEVRNLGTQQRENVSGKTTPVELSLAAGDYEVVVEHPTLGRWQFTLHVEAGGQQMIRKSFPAFDPEQVLKSYR